MWETILFILFFVCAIFCLAYRTTDRKLGRIYRKKFKLSSAEVTKLNYLTSIITGRVHLNFCIEEVVGLYIRVSRKSPEQKQRNTQFNKSLMQYCIDTLERQYKLKPSSTHHHIVLTLEEITLVEHEAGFIRVPDVEEEKEMFMFDKKRWKRIYEQAVDAFDVNKPDEFCDQIHQLASLNPKVRVTDARNIYYKGYLFLADKHKEKSLKLYLLYLSVKGCEHRAISKRNAGRLFANEKQKEQFEKICNQLKKDNNIHKALEDLAGLFVVKRKRIELNIDAIQDANIKQNNVARLLSDYLDEEEDAKSTPIPEINVITEKKESTEKNHKEFFDLFISNAFRLNRQDVLSFVRTKGLFKDQFIEHINDLYYEALDDLLIEEDGEEYILNEAYYEEVVRIT